MTALAAKLLGDGFDVVNDGLADRYFAFDAHETLSRFFVNEAIQPHLLLRLVGRHRQKCRQQWPPGPSFRRDGWLTDGRRQL